MSHKSTVKGENLTEFGLWLVKLGETGSAGGIGTHDPTCKTFKPTVSTFHILMFNIYSDLIIMPQLELKTGES